MSANLRLEDMSVAEKLQAIEDIWNDLCQKPADVPSPQWHADILREREQRIASGDAVFYDLDEAKVAVSELIK